jgi:hypothetical protein
MTLRSRTYFSKTTFHRGSENENMENGKKGLKDMIASVAERIEETDHAKITQALEENSLTQEMKQITEIFIKSVYNTEHLSLDTLEKAIPLTLTNREMAVVYVSLTILRMHNLTHAIHKVIGKGSRKYGAYAATLAFS